MGSRKPRQVRTRRDGCGFLALTCLFTCFFLVLNSALVSRFYPELATMGPALLQHPRFVQMMMFVGPVLLIFVEWWLVDLAADLLSPAGHARQSDQDQEAAENSRRR